MGRAPAEPAIPGIYRETIGPLYAYVSRRCAGERALAEDVVQETWLRAVHVWRQQGLPDSPSAWLRTVARNLLVDHYRRHRAVPIGVTAEAVLAVVDDGFRTESDDVARLIQRGLAQLPRGQARLLEAFHLDEQPVAQIAIDLKLSERAVEGRLRRARQRLRRRIEKLLGTRGGR